MSKMMMGQIDHAKKRVAELKLQKYGNTPKPPKIKGGSHVLKALLAGDVTVTGAQIRKAFDNYVNKEVADNLKEDSGTYMNDYKKTYSITKQVPSSVENALAAIIYAKPNTAEVERFESETELYSARKEAINIAATDCEDAIVLGDQQAALLALQHFAAFEV